MGFDVSWWTAFAAGFASFLTPCVLPLVPPYLCWIAGVSIGEVTGERVDAAARWRVIRAAIAFALGLGTVFMALGATASTIGQLVAENLDLLAKVAGVLIIVLGLHFMGAFRIGLLQREARVEVERRPVGILGAYVVGLAFAFGWTPCVGPILAAILFTAAQESSMWGGVGLLGGYALGMGLPFVLAGAFLGAFMGVLRRLRPWMGAIEKVTGAFLVIVGILFVTGGMAEIAYWMLEAFPSLGTLG